MKTRVRSATEDAELSFLCVGLVVSHTAVGDKVGLKAGEMTLAVEAVTGVSGDLRSCVSLGRRVWLERAAASIARCLSQAVTRAGEACFFLGGMAPMPGAANTVWLKGYVVQELRPKAGV